MTVETKNDEPRPTDAAHTWGRGTLRYMNKQFCARVFKSLTQQEQAQAAAPEPVRLDRPIPERVLRALAQDRADTTPKRSVLD